MSSADCCTCTVGLYLAQAVPVGVCVCVYIAAFARVHIRPRSVACLSLYTVLCTIIDNRVVHAGLCVRSLCTVH